MKNDPISVAAETLWQSYLAVSPGNPGRRYFEAFQFGAGREMADQLSRLVLDGIKTATSDLVWHLEAMGKARWQAGDEHVVLDGNWQPVCVIRTTELTERKFSEVDEAFAYDYGEGDRTLAWWQKHVFAWYANQCHEIGVEPTHDMPLICERFEVVYAPGRVAMI